MNAAVRICLGLCIVASGSNSQLFGQESARAGAAPSSAAKPQPTPDELTVVGSVAKFRDAFNRGDAAAIANLWIPNGEYVDEDGTHFVGREALQAEFAKFFAAHPGAKIQVSVDSLRQVTEGMAIEDGHSSIDPPPAGAPASGKYTAVHVKVDGNWLLASVRDARVEVASPYDRLQDLEWLVGTWTAEEAGANVSMTLSWGPNKSFLQRDYTVTNDAGLTIAGGKQIIAWNADPGRIQSWTFSSDGGIAIGVWSPSKDGWSIDNFSLQPDGSKATALNSFTKLDENAVVWRSTRRKSAGVALPDLDEVVLRRTTAAK